MSAKLREKSPARAREKAPMALFKMANSSVPVEHLHLNSAGKTKSEQNLQKSYEEHSNDCHQQTLTTELSQLGFAEALNHLGVKKRNEGDFGYALDLHKRALDEQLKQLGPDHLDFAHTYGSQGEVFSAKGDLERAYKSHHKALKIQVEKLGNAHIDVAASRNILGNLCRLNGNLEHAEEYLLSALNIRLILLGPNHIEIAISCNNLGDVCCDKDNFESAINYYKRAVKIQLENFGHNHLDVAASYEKLGNVCRIKGELEDALFFYRKALDIKSTLLGPDHVGVAVAYNNLAHVCFENGNERDAFHNSQRAVKILLKTPKRNQIGVAASSNNEGPRPTQTIFCQDLDISGENSEEPQLATTYEAEQQQPVIGKTTGDKQASKEDLEQFGTNHKDVSAYQGPSQDFDISCPESVEPQNPTTTCEGEAEQQEPVIGETTGDKEDDEKSQTHKAMKKFKTFQRFHSKKKGEISKTLKERPGKDALNYVLVYQDDEKGFTYSFFHNKEQAVIMLQKKQISLCAIFDVPGTPNTEKLTTKKLANINVELIDPFTKEVILRVKAIFDSGADIASFPLNRKIIKSLVNSFTDVNGKLVPIVYAKIKINDYLLDGVHEIEIEEDQDWCAIGLPQIACLDKYTKKEIIKSFIK